VNKLSRIGMDTSKSVFQLHGVDETEQPSLCRKLRRRDVIPFFTRLLPTRIGIEACAASHHWARELRALGHEVVLIPPQYIKPYVDRGKNDAADAEAICEAMSRPKLTRRFVAPKTVEQQATQMLIGVRESLMRRRTQLGNAIRGHAAEFGLVAPRGQARIEPLLERISADEAIPELAREMFRVLAEEFAHVTARLETVEAKLKAFCRDNALSRRLAEIPSIGPVTAAALVAKVGDPTAFRSARDFAAWIGLTPRDHSSGGKTRLGAITRAGDATLRWLLISGATSVIQHAMRGRTTASPWLAALLARKPAKLAAVALANKTARIAWKMMRTGEPYRPRPHGAPVLEQAA
jgi:transposase